jgi:hypothetical protein
MQHGDDGKNGFSCHRHGWSPIWTEGELQDDFRDSILVWRLGMTFWHGPHGTSIFTSAWSFYTAAAGPRKCIDSKYKNDILNLFPV